MNSRIRKQIKSYENYERVMQKHLNDDFDVYQYLAQNNITGYNIGEYSKLFNSMMVTKNQKRKKFESFKVNYDHMVDKEMNDCLESLVLGIFEGDQDPFHKAYDEIAAKTSIEFKVKETLCKEIVEIKKSIDLLKGDIGHLVDRNESAKLLESKMNKVKIVADDQLKRVSLAYLKDKEQVNIRSDMQKKFAKKIKNASMHQDSALKRMKRNYLDTMVKKKEIHERLSEISQVNASIQESGEKERQINRKRKRTLTLFKYFNKLLDLISDIRDVQNFLVQNVEEENSILPYKIDEFIDWLQTYKEKHLQTHEEQSIEQEELSNSYSQNLSMKFPSDQMELSEAQHLSQNLKINFQQLVIKEYNRITQNMDTKRSQYNLQAKRSEDLITILDCHTAELEKIQISFCQEAGLLYQVTPEMKEEQSLKLKSFGGALKTIFTFLEYIEKKLNYSNSSPNSQTRHMNKFSSTFSQFFVYRHSLTHMNKSASFQTLNLKISPTEEQLTNRKESSTQQAKHYASELYKIHCLLMGQDDFDLKKEEDLSVEIYSNLISDVGKWLGQIKDSFLYGSMTRLHPPKSESDYLKFLIQQKENIRRNSSNRPSLNFSEKLLLQSQQNDANELIEQNDEKIQKHTKRHTIHHSYSNLISKRNHSKSRYMKTSNSVNRSHVQTQKNFFNVRKLNCSTEHTDIKDAQRIQLLQDIDKHYYKMIKSTLKMEKENTRRNYLFLKNFKRTKYCSRDTILQQKRFQVSFSMLFAGQKSELMKEKSENGTKKASRKSQFSNIASLERRFSKFFAPANKCSQSEKDMRFPDSILTDNNTMKDLRQTFRRLKPNKTVHGFAKKSRFSTTFTKERVQLD